MKKLSRYMLILTTINLTSISMASDGYKIPTVTENRCRTALEQANIGLDDYATVGDCYYFGVYYDRNLESAKIYYLRSAINGSEGGRLDAGTTFLFESSNPIEANMGLYILKNFSDDPSVHVIENPSYTGEYTLRGAARYNLSVYLIRAGNPDLAKKYLALSLEDNFPLSGFALAYLNILKSNESNIETSRDYIEKAEKAIRKFHPSSKLSFSCWVKNQEREHPEFPMNKTASNNAIRLFGPCKE